MIKSIVPKNIFIAIVGFIIISLCLALLFWPDLIDYVRNMFFDCRFNSATISDDGKFVVCCRNDNTIVAFDTVTRIGEHKYFLPKKESSQIILGATLSNDGNHVFAWGQDIDLCMWDFNGKRESVVFSGHVNGTYALGLHPEVKYLLTADRNNYIRKFEISKGKLEKQVRYFGSPIHTFLFYNEGKQFFTCGPYNISLWDYSKLEEI